MADFPPNWQVSCPISTKQKLTLLSVAFITGPLSFPLPISITLTDPGAASGIGLALAQRLAADGVKNLTLVDITADHLSTAISTISAASPSAQLLPIGADCSKEEDVEMAMKETVAKFGKVDVCFNAAGITGEYVKMEVQSAENMDRVLGLNLKGVWLCERAQIRQMLKQEMRDVATGLSLKTRGSIVNVGSSGSHLGLRTINPYVMAKHGVLGLCRTDAADYGEEGIRINCVCPGWIKTAMTKMVWDSPAVNEVVKRAPMNRWGMPEEVAYTAAFLLSDRASFITGTSVDVDGGYVAQ